MGKEGTYLKIIKAIYDKPTANILNVEKQSIPFKIRNKTKVPILTTIIQHNFRSASYGNQRKERKGIQIGKEEIKLTADYMIVYIENPKDTIRKLLELIK